MLSKFRVHSFEFVVQRKKNSTNYQLITNNSKGQTLIEVVIVIAVMVIVVSALTFATIASLRNAQFAKNQSLATKWAQDGIEKVRSIRDRDVDQAIRYDKGDGTFVTKFSGLYPAPISLTCGSIPLSCPIAPDTCPAATSGTCYFYFNGGVLTSGVKTSTESLEGGNFKRQLFIEDYINSSNQNLGTQQKKVTSVVIWVDVSGKHESRLSTILGKK